MGQDPRRDRLRERSVLAAAGISAALALGLTFVQTGGVSPINATGTGTGSAPGEDTKPVAALGYVSGRLVQFGTDLPAPGARLRLFPAGAAEGTPALAQAVTGRDGFFRLTTTEASATGYVVEVVGGPYLRGWFGAPNGGEPAVQSLRSLADAYPVGAVGDVGALADWVSGTIIDVETGKPKAGVLVTARDVEDRSRVTARATSDRAGRFRLAGVGDDEVAVYVDGTAVRRSRGFVDCNGGLVATWDVACPAPTGDLGWVFVEGR